MTAWNTIILVTLALGSLAATVGLAQIQKSNEFPSEATTNSGALAGHRYRVLVSTDIGGTDPDDFQENTSAPRHSVSGVRTSCATSQPACYVAGGPLRPKTHEC